MKAPFVLRAQVAWTVLTGTYRQISVGDFREGTAYRIDLEPRSVTWWKRRNARRQIKAAERAAAQEAAADSPSESTMLAPRGPKPTDLEGD